MVRFSPKAPWGGRADSTSIWVMVGGVCEDGFVGAAMVFEVGLAIAGEVGLADEYRACNGCFVEACRPRFVAWIGRSCPSHSFDRANLDRLKHRVAHGLFLPPIVPRLLRPLNRFAQRTSAVYNFSSMRTFPGGAIAFVFILMFLFGCARRLSNSNPPRRPCAAICRAMLRRADTSI